MTERGGLEAREDLIEDKVPMPTSAQLLAGKAHFHARWVLGAVGAVVPSCGAVCIGKRRVTGIRLSH